MARYSYPGCRWPRFGTLELCVGHASKDGDESALAEQRARYARRGKGGGKKLLDQAIATLKREMKSGSATSRVAAAKALAELARTAEPDADPGPQPMDHGELLKALECIVVRPGDSALDAFKNACRSLDGLPPMSPEPAAPAGEAPPAEREGEREPLQTSVQAPPRVRRSYPQPTPVEAPEDDFDDESTNRMTTAAWLRRH